MYVLPQGTMKQPEPPGEMQTTYIILERPLNAKICCRNMDELLAHCPCVWICKQCGRMRPGTALELDPPSPGELPKVWFLSNLQVLSARRCPTLLLVVPLLLTSTESTFMTILQAALTLHSMTAPKSQCSSPTEQLVTKGKSHQRAQQCGL